MKKYNNIIVLIGAILTIVAAVTASSASTLWFHQPKTPKMLKR